MQDRIDPPTDRNEPEPHRTPSPGLPTDIEELEHVVTTRLRSSLKDTELAGVARRLAETVELLGVIHDEPRRSAVECAVQVMARVYLQRASGEALADAIDDLLTLEEPGF